MNGFMNTAMASSLTAFLLCSCTSTPNITHHEGKTFSKEDRINRKTTLTMSESKRGGAALRDKAFVHVLSNQSADQAAEQVEEVFETLDDADNASAFSHYEMERWNRYCNEGKGMDQRDWSFVAKHEYHVPFIIKEDCTPATITMEDYLSAWIQFCKLAKGVDENTMKIVTQSVKPSSLTSCPAINKFTSAYKVSFPFKAH